MCNSCMSRNRPKFSSPLKLTSTAPRSNTSSSGPATYWVDQSPHPLACLTQCSCQYAWVLQAAAQHTNTRHSPNLVRRLPVVVADVGHLAVKLRQISTTAKKHKLIPSCPVCISGVSTAQLTNAVSSYIARSSLLMCCVRSTILATLCCALIMSRCWRLSA